ncbi:hypothetical protein [Dendronalium sp. ChiSLP03b]|uniref:hypothetical protein n=1 Tax=Dendronalium sp. ChiSLP03b TaxID=3075381 RepID=UPI002AD51C09|nr:hypothetical protein [Dendronalium sp. ChiSLP03b]MDZ8204598.1 hypothetical protein [Dendronalium sp. ChiSLP03b]
MSNGNIVPTKTTNSIQAQNKARNLLDKLVSSVQTLVEDITALEVNTMVVDKISAAKFNAWQAYQGIYSINDKDYFEEKGIPEELHQRYQNLFAQLEREYFYILIDSEESLNSEQQEKIERYQNRLEWLKKQKDGEIVETDPKYVSLAQPILPPPSPILDDLNSEDNLKKQERWRENRKEIQQILNNGRFVRTLRKMSELKAALDSGDIHSTEIDIIYAQTVMQLDGDIITRYHKDLFALSEEAKNLILKAHNEGVIAGEKQWRGTFSFLINLVQGIANLSSNGRS